LKVNNNTLKVLELFTIIFQELFLFLGSLTFGEAPLKIKGHFFKSPLKFKEGKIVYRT